MNLRCAFKSKKHHLQNVRRKKKKLRFGKVYFEIITPTKKYEGAHKKKMGLKINIARCVHVKSNIEHIIFISIVMIFDVYFLSLWKMKIESIISGHRLLPFIVSFASDDVRRFLFLILRMDKKAHTEKMVKINQSANCATAETDGGRR